MFLAAHSALPVTKTILRSAFIFICLAVAFHWSRVERRETGDAAPAVQKPAISAKPQEVTPAQPLAVREMKTSAVVAFAEWSARFLEKQTAEERQAMVSEGIALASSRRAELKSLIATNPREALAASVPPVVRQQLPRAVVERLEERVNEEAFFGVLGALPGAGSEVGPAIRRQVRTDDGANYRAFVFGARTSQQTTERASIVGIAVDDFLAVDENPLRVVAAGEIPNHPNNLTQRRRVMLKDAAGFSADRVLMEQGKPKPLVDTCPVSGISTALPESSEPIAPEQPVVEAQGSFHFLCSGGHIQEFSDSLVAREGGNGGPVKPSNIPTATKSTGYKSHLLMRVAFPETNKESISEKEGYQLGKDVEDWFVDSSYGKLSFITTVTPLLILPRTEAWYKNEDTGGSAYEVLADARIAAKAAGFDPANFDYDTVIYTGSPGSFGGQAYVGGKGCWLKSGTGVGVACHEYGHNFGLLHANFWNTNSTSIIGPGTHSEYGDSFDTMGSASAGDLQFNACHKNILGWMPDALVHSVSASGTYRIFQMDQPRQDPALRYALKVRKDSDRDYWVDLRQRSFSSNRWVAGGVFLHWSPWVTSEGGSHLLDTTVGSPDAKTDSPVVIGRTFSDTESGIHITPVAKNPTVPPSFDVVVNLGAFAGNQAPTLAISASTTTVATNVNVTLTAVAADGNSDALSYWWDFGDKSFATTNTAVVTKSWTAAGRYVVRCVASDMKGGTASRSVLINVGSPSDFTVSGTVTLGGNPLPDVRIHNGKTGTSYRGSFTNSDGTFIVSGLAAGAYTFGAAMEGFTFAPATSAAVTVGPSATNMNFTATEDAQLSITAVTPTVAEGASGTLRISRTGSTTNALTVNILAPGGFATKGTDYTLTPDTAYTDPYTFFTIPAGTANLDIVFAAQNDTGQEGPEMAVFELLPSAGVTLTNTSATITISDPDTTKPIVRLAILDADAGESGDAGTLIIERLGSTTAALSVSVAMSGGATNGTDYTSIPSTITIPAGQSQVAVNVAPIADSNNEGTETAVLTISTSTAYIRPSSSSAYTGIVHITDSQMPVVSIVATDSAAAEAGNDPGVFVISRTGATTQALTVQLGLTGSALQGVDFATIPAQVTIPAASDFATVVITPINDGIGEPAQTARLYIRAESTYVIGTAGEATVTITDDSDVPYVTIGSTNSAKESGTNGTFKISTQGSGTGNITVRYTVSGTATNGTDFSTLSGTLSIGRNTSTNITITPIQDTAIEGYESVTLTLTPDAAYSLAIDSAATVRIEDDELPQVNVSTHDGTFSEAAGSIAKFFISRTGSTTAALTVNYTISGTATSGTDYTAPSGTMTIPAAAAGAFVDIAILADTLLEGTETITLNIADDATYRAGFTSATYYLPDAQTPTLSLRYNPNSATVQENAGTVTATITLSAVSAEAVSVDAFINGGTALGGGIDHGFTRTTVEFAPGETSKTVVIPVMNDTASEGNETLILNLANPARARLSSTAANNVFTITISDDDTLPTATAGFAVAAASVTESLASPMIVALARAQTAAVSVDYAVTGGTATAADYSSGTGTLTFAPGETSKALPLSIVNDGDQESSEIVIVTLSNPTGGIALSPNTTHTRTVIDDDTMSFSISATTAAAAEPAANGLFTITRSGTGTGDVTLNLDVTGTATAGGDYTAIAANVVFPGGSTSVTLPVSVIDDALAEESETVFVAIAAGPYSIGTPSSATVTIADNEPSVSIVATDASAAEAGPDAGTIVFTRTGSVAAPLTLNVSVGGSATSGSDYAAFAFPVVIPAGDSTTTITVLPVDDASSEGNETVSLTLNTASGYRISGASQATVTIADDDVNLPPVVSIQSPAVNTLNLSAGVGLILEGAVSDDGKPVGGSFVSGWSSVSGPGPVAFGNASLANTTATFSAPGTYVLRLSASDGELSASSEITVTVPDSADEWTGTNITGTTPAGNFSESADTITVQGGGTNISGTADTFYFVNRPLFGSCDFRARIASMTVAGSSAKAGVMIRQSLAGNSRGAFMSAYSSGSTLGSWRTRSTDGAAWSSSSASGAPTFPRWVRVVKNGGSYTGYTSTDGNAWTQTGQTGSVSMMEPMLLGLAVTSNNTSALCTAVFDNVTIIQTGSTAPFVNAGSDGSTVLPQPAALNGTTAPGSVAGALSTTWTKISGAGAVVFADPSAPTTTATFGAAGTYVLRLIADDTQAKTFNDVTIIAGVPEVNITALSPDVLEAGGGAAMYSITRTGAASSPLTVNLVAGGTANNSDYTDAAGVFASGILSMPIGTESTVISAQILRDLIVEGNETLTLAIAPDVNYGTGTATLAEVTILDAPVLSIAATTPLAAEFGLVPGAVTVTRAGSTAEPLSFALDFAGLAISGADYAPTGSTLLIPAGSTSVQIPVVPLADAISEGDEVAAFSLLDSASYAVAIASAQITVTDLPADGWRFGKFGVDATNPAISGDLADPDGDGIVNLLEYAFALEPLAVNAPAQPALNAGGLSIIYRKNLLAPDLSYLVQKSTDVSAGWMPASPAEEVISDDGSVRVIRATVPVEGSPSLLLRLRVSRP